MSKDLQIQYSMYVRDKICHRWTKWTCKVDAWESQKIDATPTDRNESHGPNPSIGYPQVTCLPNSKQVTHTRSTWDRMRPHTINNNWLCSLKDFPRQKCLPYQYGASLPPSPAVPWYHIWPLCAQGDFQPLKRWACWEWATDLWAASL